MKQETAEKIVEEVFSANPRVGAVLHGRSLFELERTTSTPRNALMLLPEPLGWLAPLNVVSKDNHGAVWAEAYIVTPGQFSKLGCWLLENRIDEGDPVEAALESFPLSRGGVLSLSDRRVPNVNQRTWTFDLGLDTPVQLMSEAPYDRFDREPTNVFAQTIAAQLGWTGDSDSPPDADGG